MEPAAIGVKLASSVVFPLVKRLFTAEEPGAGLVDRPVRISALVFFKGEKRSLDAADLRRLADELVRRAHPAPPDGEERAVADALAHTLHTLGDLTLTDVEAVELGPHGLARALRTAGDRPERRLSADATYVYEGLVEAACLHILHFFSRRSAFIARTLVEQTRRQAQLIAKLDTLLARTPLPDAADVAFERDHLNRIANLHGKLTIYGIDLTDSPGSWPLDAAYLRLEAVGRPVPRLDPLAVPEEPLFTIPEEPSTDTLPADQALAEHDRILLRGAAGSGKTTLVQWLAVAAARPTREMAYLGGRIPFVLPLRRLTRHGERLPSPKSFLAAAGSPDDGAQPPGWEQRVLAAGRALILVDGIDEVPERERAAARGWLDELLAAYPDGNRWLVTTRPTAVPEGWLRGQGFTDLTLAPMTPAGVAAFIGRWHAAAGADEQLRGYERQLLDAVRAKPDLGLLATSPLLCALICALNRDRRGYLPRGRKELYAAALSMLLLRRDRERGMTGPELGEEPQVQLLQRLAYWLVRNGRQEMDRARAEQILGEALPAVPEAGILGEAPAVLDHFLLRSGLLQEPGPDTVGFVHRTFQDYLGARAAVEEGDFGVLAQHAGDDQWEDVIRMAVGHARPRERADLITEILELATRQPDEIRHTRVRLTAAGCLEHAPELPADVREKVARHTAGIIPPRDEEQARVVAAAGPIVLDLLPEPEGLDDDTALYVAVCATHVASERAVPYLAALARHHRHAVPVQNQLARSWHRFDARTYAEAVLPLLDPTAYLMITTDEQVRVLPGLGARPKLDFRDAVGSDVLTAYVARTQLTDLLIRDSRGLRDLDFLRGQRSLSHLRVTRCLQLTDLGGLAGLPLESLVLSELHPRAPLDVLGTLPELRELSIGREGLRLSLDELPDGLGLRLLNLRSAPALTGGLRGLERYGTLRHLKLGKLTSPLHARDWRHIAALPELEQLSVHCGSLDRLPVEPALPGVRVLTLQDWHGPYRSRLETVVRAFPGLELLRFRNPTVTPDLTPLAGAPRLRAVGFPDGYIPHDAEPPPGIAIVTY